MSNLPKKQNKNSLKKTNWDEVRKAGGVAPSPEFIQAILQGEGENENVRYTRDEVQSRITGYFNGLLKEVEDEDTGEILHIWKSAPTKVGLALALGISVRTLVRYEYDKNRYEDEQSTQAISANDLDLVHRALMLIHDFYESELSKNKNNSGVIFWLLNSQSDRWSNSQQIEVTAKESSRRRPQLSKEEILEIDEPETMPQLPNFEDESMEE